MTLYRPRQCGIFIVYNFIISQFAAVQFRNKSVGCWVVGWGHVLRALYNAGGLGRENYCGLILIPAWPCRWPHRLPTCRGFLWESKQAIRSEPDLFSLITQVIPAAWIWFGVGVPRKGGTKKRSDWSIRCVKVDLEYRCRGCIGLGFSFCKRECHTLPFVFCSLVCFSL